MGHDNPFLGVKLFRNTDDQKRIDTAKDQAQRHSVNTNFGFQYAWYSQNSADEQSYYEEWENQDGETVAVTHILGSPSASAPAIDAKFIGIVCTKKRIVNLHGEELSEKGIRAIFNGVTRLYTDIELDTVSAVAERIGAGSACNVRIEENGQTIYEGPLRRAYGTLDRSKAYSLIFTQPAPVIQEVKAPPPPATPYEVRISNGTSRSFPRDTRLKAVLASLNTTDTQYAAISENGADISAGYANHSLAEIREGSWYLKAKYLIQGVASGWADSGTNLAAFLTRAGIKGEMKYAFNGIAVEDPRYFLIKEPGTLSQVAAKLEFKTIGCSYKDDAPQLDYVKTALSYKVQGATAVEPSFTPKKDYLGETHTTKESWEKHISSTYREYRSSGRFTKLTFDTITNQSFKTRASRMGFDGSDELVYMTEAGGQHHHPICSYKDWMSVLGVAL